MAKINVTTVVHPNKEVVGVCSECGKEVGNFSYDGYYDHGRQKLRMKNIPSCPHCGAEYMARSAFIKWEKTAEGNYIAEAKNGDFLIWKYGFGYRWRYRKYGAQCPNGIFYAKTKELAKKACQQHAEWKI